MEYLFPMKLISWNMASASPRIAKNRLEESWEYLLNKNPDIVLVQEARIPNFVSENFNVIWAPAYDKTKWGSAVVTRYPIKSTFDVACLEPQLEGIMRRFKGQTVGAVVEIPTWGDLVTISVHTPAKTLPLSEIPPEILPIIKLKLNPKIWRADVVYGALRNLPVVAEHYIFGGDFNTSRLFDKIHGVRGNREYFERMERAGFYEFPQPLHDTEPRTWFRKGDGPYQLDYIFCDKDQAKYISGCSVDPQPAIDGLSDHAIIIVDFTE